MRSRLTRRFLTERVWSARPLPVLPSFCLAKAGGGFGGRFQIRVALCSDSFGFDHALRLEYVWPEIPSLPAGLRPRNSPRGSRDPRSALERRGHWCVSGCAAICGEDELHRSGALDRYDMYCVCPWADDYVACHDVLALRDGAVCCGICRDVADGRYQHHYPGTRAR